MKKIALTSLLAVFAVSGANAANVINNNPLYRPGEGRFYSITSVGSHTQSANEFSAKEELGYGITDRLAIAIATSAEQANWFDTASWGDIELGVNYRAIDMGAWKADLFGGYSMNPVWGDHKPFMDKDISEYTWTAGVRAGYATDAWTVAGHIAFDYTNTESFNWDDDAFASHKLRAGLDGQLVLCPKWNAVAGVEYNADLDNWSDNLGYWTGLLGLNYNIDETKFVGAYVTKEMTHVNEEDVSGKWEIADGFGFGVKFGIDF